jgi:hypothetical protein
VLPALFSNQITRYSPSLNKVRQMCFLGISASHQFATDCYPWASRMPGDIEPFMPIRAERANTETNVSYYQERSFKSAEVR